MGVEPSVIAGVVLAVDEAATNIIVHGYGGQAGDIDVRLSRKGDALVVRLYDRAPPFDPATVPLPDTTLPLDERPIGGMGIFFMHRVMDEVCYRRTSDGGNELTLIKRGALVQRVS